jgi:hypothetical protein
MDGRTNVFVEQATVPFVEFLHQLGAGVHLAIRFIKATPKLNSPHPQKGEGYQFSYLNEEPLH